MIDTVLLSQYIDNVTDEEVANKILELTYGTSDPDEIAALDDDTKTKYEENYAQSMILSGYQDDEEGYARLIVARQNYVKDKISEDGTITENDVAEAYLNSYFEDISAIRIRFTSAADAKAVMQRFNLLSYENLYLREYNGYVFKHEDLKDPDGNLAEAFTTVDTYYFDEDANILTSTGTTVYELGANGIYSDGENQFVLEQATGDLLNGLNEVVLSNEVIFDTEDEAVQYKEDHTIYFTVTRTDPFDTNETINVVNALREVAYTIDPSNDHIYDADSNDVTYTTDLYVNKVYTTIDKVTTVTTNNSTALSTEEVMAKYVEMYNYVYDLYRDPLPTGLTDNQYAALDNDYLKFNFETEADLNSNMATYMFDTLTLDVTRYTATPKSFTYTSDSYYYMVYKLTEVEKTDLMTIIFDDLTPLITIPTQIADSITLPTTTYYDGTITWATSNASVLTSLGT
ncbi:MAG TPA: hypothetical protein PKU69_03940, partial [Bacillota bacterium]|nr:hypothetical protein [Bacillota bacterium]